MRRTTNNPNNAPPANSFNLSVSQYKLLHVKWSEDGKTCRFTLCFFGVYLYGITLRYDKEGNPWFSFPSWKGKDGKFFQYFYLTPDEETLHAIVSALEEM